MLSQKLRLSLICAVILLGCGVWWFSMREPSGPVPGQSQLRAAPGFSLKDSAGRVHTLQEMRGKVTLIHFWAAWCPPCLTEIPEIVKFADDLKNEPKLQVVAISLDEKWSDAEKVLQPAKLPPNMISLLDGGANIPDAYGTYQYPETYLVNPKGQIVAKWVGGQPWSNPKTEDLMRQELVKETGPKS